MTTPDAALALLAEALCLTGHVGNAHRVTLGIDPDEHRDHECRFKPDIDGQIADILATEPGARLLAALRDGLALERLRQSESDGYIQVRWGLEREPGIHVRAWPENGRVRYIGDGPTLAAAISAARAEPGTGE